MSPDLIDGIERRVPLAEIRVAPRTLAIGQYTAEQAARFIALCRGAKLVSECDLRSPDSR
jgi:hypothetical protein